MVRDTDKKLVYAVGYICLVMAGSAFAFVPEDSPAPMVRMGGIEVYPGISVVEHMDSNPFKQTTGNEQSSNVTVISPSLLLQTKEGGNQYSLSYTADIGKFSGSAKDNYVDHDWLAIAELALGTSATLKIAPEYKVTHSDRGANYNPAFGITKNNANNAGVAGKLTYGSDEAKGNLVVDAAYHDIKNTNNPAATFDNAVSELAATLNFKVMPKTTVFAWVANTSTAYVNSNVDAAHKIATAYNSDEQRYMLGVKWEATAQTSGTFKLGLQQKKFNNSVKYPNFSGLGWDGDVHWTPQSFYRLDVTSSNMTHDSPTTGGAIVSSSNTLDFSYDLNERATVHFNAANGTDDFKGSTVALGLPVDRSDTTNTLGLKATYKVLKWLESGVEFSDANRTSNASGNDFKRKIMTLSIRSIL